MLVAVVVDELSRGVEGRDVGAGTGFAASCFSSSASASSLFSSLFVVVVVVVVDDGCCSEMPKESRSARRSSALRAMLGLRRVVVGEEERDGSEVFGYASVGVVDAGGSVDAGGAVFVVCCEASS